MLALLGLLSIVLPTLAGPAEDEARLGSYYTDIAIYRSGSGNNVVSVGLGDPVQDFNLTLSTTVDFSLVASEDCDNCLKKAESYDIKDSRTIITSQRALSVSAIFPTSQGSIDVIKMDGNLVTERITDPREDSYDRVVGIIDKVEEVTVLGQRSRAANLPEGVSGFFGLGVNQANKQWSIMPSLYQTNGRGAPAGVQGYVVGLDMANYNRDTGVQAGTMHFGGVPSGVYTGNFNWRDANTTVAGGWGMDLDRLRVSGKVVDGGQYYASLDPGFDAIYVPAKVAEELFAAIKDATQDSTEPTRWNLPCDANIPMSVTIANREYKVDPTQLVQQRGASPTSCWSTIVAWQNGSLPDTNGEIRLGTPFLAGVYAAFYYSEKQQFVGLAGKPGSVNDFNALSKERNKPNGKLAGILIGSLLAALILLLLACYSRNRNSFQSVWYRGIRRQHRAQVNALVRAATIPPPMVGAVGAGMVVPPMMHPGQMGMMPGPMGMGMGRGVPAYMPVPMGPGPASFGGPIGGHGYQPQGGGWGQPPPMYQAPMQPQPHTQPPHPPQHAQQYPQQHQMPPQAGHQQYLVPMKQPVSVEHTPRGTYSARHQSLPLPSTRHPSKPSRHSHQPRHHPQAGPSGYGPRHGDIETGHGDLGEGLLAPDQDIGRYHTAPGHGQGYGHGQKLHFGPVGTRRDHSTSHGQGHGQVGGGPKPDEESMVQRDRRKVADGAALHAAQSQPQPSQLDGLRQARFAEVQDCQKEEYDAERQLHHQPNPAASSTQNRKSWRDFLQKDKTPRYPIQSYRSETGRSIMDEHKKAKAKKWEPKPSSTWIKSHYGERGWSGWKKAEREKERRAGVMSGGGLPHGEEGHGDARGQRMGEWHS